jgi:hypothetical protein
MKNFLAHLTITAAIALIGIAPLITAANAALWTGKATANVNLRSAPGLHGAVITGLIQGTVLEVLDEQDGWLKVAHRNDAFGYQGWVYGRYVLRLPLEAAAPAAPVQTETDRNATDAASASSPPAPSMSAAQPEETLSPTSFSEPVDGVDAGTHPAAGAVDSPPLSTHSDVTPTPAPTIQQSPKESETVAPPSSFSRDVLSTVTPDRTAASPPRSPQTADTASPRILPWLSLMLRLSTVLMATMALFLANRALHTARDVGYRTIGA